MDQTPINPLFSKPLSAYVGQGQTPQLTSSAKPKPSGRQVPTKIKEAIAKLGLRYRPTSQTDLEAHAGQLAMLATDLHDMPADLLERAIEEWAVKSPFMPKAFDLVQLAKGYLTKAEPKQAGPTDWEMMARRYNDRMATDPEARRDVRWTASQTGISMQFDPSYVAPMDRFLDDLAAKRMTQADVDRAPKYWRNVAEERGYLRRMDDGSHILRQWKGPLA